MSLRQMLKEHAAFQEKDEGSRRDAIMCEASVAELLTAARNRFDSKTWTAIVLTYVLHRLKNESLGVAA